MMVLTDLVQLAQIEQAREFVKVEHRVVFAVFAEECDVFAEVHVFEVIGDKAAVATLDALAEFVENVSFVCHLTGAASILLACSVRLASDFINRSGKQDACRSSHFTTPRFEVSIKLTSRSASVQPSISARIFSTAWVVFSLAESSR